MRNYLYISDAKVDAYLGQMQVPEKRTVAKKIGIDLKVLQASAEIGTASPENRITRLQAVEEQLRSEKSIGPLDSDKPWIEDTVEVAAAAFKDAPALMFFFADLDRQFFALAGSAHHVIGNLRPESASSSISHLHTLLNTLEAATRKHALVAERSEETVERYLTMGVSRPVDVSAWTEVLADTASKFASQPTQVISFLARRLTSDEYGTEGMRYTLASPLYIEVEDYS